MRYFIVIMLLAGSLPAATQSVSPVSTLVDSQRYIFQARTAQSLRGPVRNLASTIYTLKITKDTISSDLPYFGRAYVAPMDPSQAGLEFVSTKFDYTLTPGKKEGWTVLIKPKNALDIREIQLNISPAGYASVQVICTNRDPITFNGIIVAPTGH